ncbi:hypothetical protein [Streptomyces sp. NPDC050738]|uniref:hypothetical protein n=1 Tax=Streptomyces sp. NPDC050738 TaxID=3154744 RepID=UPI00342FACC8
MQDAFVAAAFAEQTYTGGPIEICGVLNRMPRALLEGDEAQAIDVLDAVIDELYRAGELSCPGHRWRSEPRPDSIRGNLTAVYEAGHVRCDPQNGRWTFGRFSYFMAMRDAPRGPNYGRGDGLMRFQRKH